VKPISVINVVGARPNFVKIAPIMSAMGESPHFEARLVHTGQHYDREMAQVFFEELGIPAPDKNLGVGSGSPASQTAEVMMQFEKELSENRPDLVVVVGDVNSTLACALAASKLGIKVAHVEAGLRSFDRTMPEEINRILTDHISDYLLVSDRSGIDNLRAEGISGRKVSYVGNVMIDTLLRCRERAAQSDVRQRVAVAEGDYAVLTIHRPSNVDNLESFTRILDAIEQVQRNISIVFPMHPRTRHRIGEWGLDSRLEACANLHIAPPLGYIDFMGLMQNARLVLTDSGGIQEETCLHGVPCIVMRENTERPVTLGSGYHVLVGSDTQKIVKSASEYLAAPAPEPFDIEGWDGHTAERIVDILAKNRAQLKGN
jgi:UDP-N-acetylglucosamine 2-epimerase (non-hydrolysing)